MKRLALSFMMLVSLLCAPLAVAGSVSAVDVFQPCNGTTASGSSVCQDVKSQSGSTSNPLVDDIKVVIHILAFIIGFTSVIILIISGLRMITSSGDANAAKSARGGVIYAAVGLVIAALSEAIVALVLNKIG